MNKHNMLSIQNAAKEKRQKVKISDDHNT